jgi:hypothetical protein
MAGRSVLPLLAGGPEWPAARLVESGKRGIMVRTRRFKYVRYAGDEIDQLFDLESDSLESSDLARDPAFRPIRQELAEAIGRRRNGRADVPLAGAPGGGVDSFSATGT